MANYQTSQRARYGARRAALVFPAVLLLIGCSPAPVLKQEIPVSSDPLGATVYAGGAAVGTTPTRVSLERNRNHMLTVVKAGYRPQDIPIRQDYQSDKVLLSAVQSGINSAAFFKDATMGIQRGMDSIASQERTGAAYRLTPSTVSVRLERDDAQAQPGPAANGATQVSTGEAGRQSVMDASPTAVLGAAALAGASQAKPVKKDWTVSSRSSARIKPDGSFEKKSSSTSVGVSVDPVGVVNLVNGLFLRQGSQ